MWGERRRGLAQPWRLFLIQQVRLIDHTHVIVVKDKIKIHKYLGFILIKVLYNMVK